MSARRRSRFCQWVLMLGVLCAAGAATARLNWDELNGTRVVRERDWLSLKLEVLGLRLSYPAYRIHLELDSEDAVVFTFLASSGLVEHLTEKVEQVEAEKMLSYHATGIRAQVERLLQDEFPGLWSGYEPVEDFMGTFLGPGKNWDDPPRTLGRWEAEQFVWNR